MFASISRIIQRARIEFAVRRDPVAHARKLGVKIGEGSLIYSVDPNIFGSEPYLVRLGKNCHVTDGVRFVTHDGGVLLFRREYPDLDVVAPIILGDNVYIGLRTILLPGITIGDNVVIGAGSVVSRSIPSNCVAAGVPARVVKSLSDYEKKVLAASVRTGAISDHEKRPILRSLFKDKLC